MVSALFPAIIVLVAFFLAPELLNQFFSPTFKVHSEGIVVVTGAGSGIGLATAKELALKGYYVLGGVRKEKDGEEMKGIANLQPIILDITNSEHLQAAVKQVRSLKYVLIRRMMVRWMV